MLIVISPAKNLDYDTPTVTDEHSQPALLDDAKTLMKDLKKMAPHELSGLMGISDKLGTLNYDRNRRWCPPFTPDNARQAIFAFKGDVYVGFDAYNLKKRDLTWAQKHLRILSGLYGILRPLDLMQPYRLEMGTRFANPRGKDLYAFWGDTLTETLNEQLRSLKSHTLINLASNEYFKAVRPKKLDAEIITPVFKDWKNGQYKMVSFYAKKARGLMSAYIVRNRLTRPEQLKGFDSAGYAYDDALSSDREWVFTRREAP